MGDTDAVRLDIGAGRFRLPGFTPIDRSLGKEAYPLTDYADNSVDEIRASHVLEHFDHRESVAALREWVRVLKPGGRIRLAVPDFAYIVKSYDEGKEEPIAHYLFGSQIDPNDYHKTVYDKRRLEQEMLAAGLQDIEKWTSEQEDCAALPCSLNLQGIKADPTVLLLPNGKLPKITMVMSTPRLGFTDNMFCAVQATIELACQFKKHTGAFWDQCLTRCIEECLADGTELILTLDYDSVFRSNDIRRMASIMVERPDVDAIAPIQCKRADQALLMGVLQPDGTEFPNGTPITVGHFSGELMRAKWAHFGCTLLRVSKFANLKKPWFLGEPDANGGWGEGRIDPDIYFWRNWHAAGNTLYLASRIAIGHQQVMTTWPGTDAQPIHQYPTHGSVKPPTGVWQ